MSLRRVRRKCKVENMACLEEKPNYTDREVDSFWGHQFHTMKVSRRAAKAQLTR